MTNPLLLYKALSDETRLKSLLLIQKHGELCVCDLMQALNLSQPKVSRHLAELRKNGLVQNERRGKWVYYQISPQLAAWAKQILEVTLKHNERLIETEQLSIQNGGCSNDITNEK